MFSRQLTMTMLQRLLELIKISGMNLLNTTDQCFTYVGWTKGGLSKLVQLVEVQLQTCDLVVVL